MSEYKHEYLPSAVRFEYIHQNIATANLFILYLHLDFYINTNSASHPLLKHSEELGWNH